MKKLIAFALLMASAAFCKDHAQQGPNFTRQFRTLIPLGAERIDARPSKRSIYLLATAESPYFEGWHGPENGRGIYDADGTRVRFYPEQIGFRLTATAMRPDLLMIDSYGTLDIQDAAINDYLLNLKFRVLVFHGLDVTRVEPESTRLIGMPADVHYDERVYQVYFKLPHPVPLDDRIVLEVLSPTGYRVCKFHLDF